MDDFYGESMDKSFFFFFKFSRDIIGISLFFTIILGIDSPKHQGGSTCCHGCQPRLKIFVSMDISVLGFYGYIEDRSVDIFT